MRRCPRGAGPRPDRTGCVQPGAGVRLAAGIVDRAVDEDAVRSTAIEIAQAQVSKAGDTLGTAAPALGSDPPPRCGDLPDSVKMSDLP